MREVHGVVAGKGEDRILVQDDIGWVRLCMGDAWIQLTHQEARQISQALSASASRVEKMEKSK